MSGIVAATSLATTPHCQLAGWGTNHGIISMSQKNRNLVFIRRDF